MKNLAFVLAATMLVATPAFAKKARTVKQTGSLYDASTETGNTKKAPSLQSGAAGALQTGSGQETGGYARERIRSR